MAVCRSPRLLMAVAALAVGCGRPVSQSPPAILVAAASDLARVSRPLATAFEQSTGLRARFGFGSSGQLEQQIRQGAPFDVYAPAARSFCRSLKQDGFTDGEDRPYARGHLVVWSRMLQLDSLAQLADAQVRRIAIANPRYAPYGAAAQQALQKAGLWLKLQPKIVYAENVAHAVQMAETRNAEAAMAALALVQGSGSFTAVDQSLYEPIEQAAVVLRSSQNKPAARAFIEFLSTPEAQRILQEYGFSSP